MAKIVTAICLLAFMAVLSTVYGTHIGGLECKGHACKCCVVPYTRCATNKGSNDYCLDGCKAEIYGHRCYGLCPENCATCDQDSTDGGYPCTQCTDRTKYGYYCTTSCSVGCVDGTCNVDGGCACKAGYSGDICDVMDIVCPDKCQTCTASTNCQTCVNGYYNGVKYGASGEYTTVCKHPCSTRPHCKACTGYNSCDQCDDGYYGQNCETPCSSGCHTRTCTKESGNCDCKSSFIGDKCDQCIAGKYSDNCSFDCLSQDCTNNVCIRDSGRCSSCNAGYYGNDLCDQSCSTSCKYGTCDFTLGSCDCITGYSGDKCCLNNDNCDTCLSPTKCSKCKSGYSGDKCCVNNGRCITCSSPSACFECKPGYSGDKCCLTNNFCLECLSYTVCSKCIDGRYGDSCTDICPDNCGETKCNVTNGTCLVGCVNGFYGDKCKSPCDENCVKGTCLRLDGICSYGCKHGSTESGAECMIAAASSDSDDGGSSGTVIGGSVGGIIAVLAVVGILVFVVLRRRSKDNDNIAHTYENTRHEDNDHTLSEEAVLAEVDEGYEIPISNPGRPSAPEVETTNEYEEPDLVPQNMQRPGLSADHDGEGVVIEKGNVNTYEPLSRQEINPDTYSTINTYESLSRPETNADVYSQLEQSAYEDTTI